MTRRVSHTLVLEGQLEAVTPLHIGGADNGDTTDMPLAVNGRDKFYIPGTSLAGALRACFSTRDEDPVWGFSTALSDGGKTSFMVVDDAEMLADSTVTPELWHGVGIDRRHGVAAKHIKFDRQVLPRGARFRFRLQREVDQPAASSEHSETLQSARAEMAAIASALVEGRVPIGGSQTRGFGRVRLLEPVASEIDWTSPAGLLSHLSGQQNNCLQEWNNQLLSSKEDRHSSHPLEIRIKWRPLGPVMSKSAAEGLSADIMPFITRNEQGRYAMALPGSALKGVLRQQAERIVRTVLDLSVGQVAHHEQVDVPLVRDLFGAARPGDQPRQSTGGGHRAARGKLFVDTCYAKFAESRQAWDQVDATDDAWVDGRWRKLYRADHVAIDRWTGGAADSMLYNAVEPDAQIEWEPLTLRVATTEQSPAMLALLWLVIRDLCRGALPIGFGVNRGFGDIQVEHIEITPSRHAPIVVPVSPAGQMDESGLEQMLAEWKQGWQSWLKEHADKAATEEDVNDE